MIRASHWLIGAQVLLPKVMNAFVAFLVDIGLCKMTERVLGQRFVTTAVRL